MIYKNLEVFEPVLFLWNDSWSAILVHGHISQDRFRHPAAYFIDFLDEAPVGHRRRHPP